MDYDLGEGDLDVVVVKQDFQFTVQGSAADKDVLFRDIRDNTQHHGRIGQSLNAGEDPLRFGFTFGCGDLSGVQSAVQRSNFCKIIVKFHIFVTHNLSSFRKAMYDC